MVAPNPNRTIDTGPTWPRWISLALGAWLFVSAFVWPHAGEAQTNTWILGLLIAIAAAASLYAPGVRVITALLAVWLFISTLVMSHITSGTILNNLIVAVLVFLASLVPGGARRAMPGPRQPAYG